MTRVSATPEGSFGCRFPFAKSTRLNQHRANSFGPKSAAPPSRSRAASLAWGSAWRPACARRSVGGRVGEPAGRRGGRRATGPQSAGHRRRGMYLLAFGPSETHSNAINQASWPARVRPPADQSQGQKSAQTDADGASCVLARDGAQAERKLASNWGLQATCLAAARQANPIQLIRLASKDTLELELERS